MAKKRTNVIPIIEDARYPGRYRMLVGMVDVIFADVAQPDQAKILALNAAYFLIVEGHFLLSIKANCIDSTMAAEEVYEREVAKLREVQLKAREMVKVGTHERNHAVVVVLTGSKRNNQQGHKDTVTLPNQRQFQQFLVFINR